MLFRETSWLEAEDVCIKNGGHLASLQPDEVGNVDLLIFRNMATSYWNSIFFIGLNDREQVGGTY